MSDVIQRITALTHSKLVGSFAEASEEALLVAVCRTYCDADDEERCDIEALAGEAVRTIYLDALRRRLDHEGWVPMLPPTLRDAYRLLVADAQAHEDGRSLHIERIERAACFAITFNALIGNSLRQKDLIEKIVSHVKGETIREDRDETDAIEIEVARAAPELKRMEKWSVVRAIQSLRRHGFDLEVKRRDEQICGATGKN